LPILHTISELGKAYLAQVFKKGVRAKIKQSACLTAFQIFKKEGLEGG
jgi:hypothetical protein